MASGRTAHDIATACRTDRESRQETCFQSLTMFARNALRAIAVGHLQYLRR